MENVSDSLLRSIVHELYGIACLAVGRNSASFWIKSLRVNSSKVLDEYRRRQGRDPQSQILVDIIVAFVANVDGNWMPIMLFCQLIHHSWELPRISFPSLRAAASLLFQYFQFNGPNQIALFESTNKSLAYNIVSHQLSRSCPWLLEIEKCTAARSIIDAGYGKFGEYMKPFVHYLPMCGLSATLTHSISDCLLLEIPIPQSLGKIGCLKSATVAVFDCSLEFPQLSDAPFSILELDANGKHSAFGLQSLELESLKKFISSLLKYNIRLVVSQKRVHPYLQYQCSLLGIVCIPRVSSIHIGALLRATGARQLGSITQFFEAQAAQNVASCLGYASAVECIQVYGKLLVAISCSLDNANSSTLAQLVYFYCSNSFIEARSDIGNSGVWVYCDSDENIQNGVIFAEGVLARRKLVTTMVVCSHSESSCQDLQFAIEKCFRIINSLLRNPELVRGGGFWLLQAGLFLHEIYRMEISWRSARPVAESKQFYRDQYACQLVQQNESISKFYTINQKDLQSFCTQDLHGIYKLGQCFMSSFNSISDCSEPTSFMLEPMLLCRAYVEQGIHAAENISQIDGILYASYVSILK